MNVDSVINTNESIKRPIEGGLPYKEETARTDKKPVQEPDRSRIVAAAVDMQKNLKIMHNVDLQFSVHEASNQIMITVKDESTGKVIREIPPRELLDLAAKFDEMIGMIIDKRG